MNKKDFQKSFLPKLPDSPGIYLFKSGKNLLYVGKATSLKQRVRSYFSDDLIKTRGRLLVDMITIADKIEFQKTDSVLEALILEAHFIKENQPKYNTKDKDNKSYNYVVITDEEYPRVLVVRGRNLEQAKKQGHEASYKGVFGPFPYGGELKEALRLVRKIFPFRDKCIPLDELKTKTGVLAVGIQGQQGQRGQRGQQGQVTGAPINPRPCFNRSIGLCPGVCTGEISKKDYSTQIKNIKMFFEGQKPALLKSLQKQMAALAKAKEFEKAGQIKKTIFALNHIQDVSLIKNVSSGSTDFIVQDSFDASGVELSVRIEAYDIAHMSGKNMVGSMVVMEDGELANDEYRKFIIRNFDSANDPGALDEMIRRRVKHPEWKIPNIVVLDGNEVQLKRAYEAWNGTGDEVIIEEGARSGDRVVDDSAGKSKVLFCSIVKDKAHQAKDIIFFGKKGWEKFDKKVLREQIVKINAEAHRFAITFHKKRRAKSFL